MTFLYCQNTDCGVYLGASGADSCAICGWEAQKYDSCTDCGKPNEGIHTCSPQVKNLVRLTEDELFNIFDRTSCGDDAQRNVLNFANAIMDAMEEKNQ